MPIFCQTEWRLALGPFVDQRDDEFGAVGRLETAGAGVADDPLRSVMELVGTAPPIDW